MMSAMTPPPMYISYLRLASGTRYALSISHFRPLTNGMSPDGTGGVEFHVDTQR